MTLASQCIDKCCGIWFGSVRFNAPQKSGRWTNEQIIPLIAVNADDARIYFDWECCVFNQQRIQGVTLPRPRPDSCWNNDVQR